MDDKRRPGKRYGSKPFKKTGGSRRPGGFGRVRPIGNGDSTAPEDLAEYILKVLAKDPDALQFERQSLNPGRSRVAVTWDPLVTGRLIGKDGRTITALRSLIRAAASRFGKRVDIEIS